MAKLKPCPFCGWRDFGRSKTPLGESVVCENCKVTGPQARLSEDPQKAWNARDDYDIEIEVQKRCKAIVEERNAYRKTAKNYEHQAKQRTNGDWSLGVEGKRGATYMVDFFAATGDFSKLVRV